MLPKRTENGLFKEPLCKKNGARIFMQATKKVEQFLDFAYVPKLQKVRVGYYAPKTKPERVII